MERLWYGLVEVERKIRGESSFEARWRSPRFHDEDARRLAKIGRQGWKAGLQHVPELACRRTIERGFANDPNLRKWESEVCIGNQREFG